MVGTTDWDIGFDVTLKGADQVIRQVQGFVPEMRRTMEDAVMSLGQRLRDLAREKASGEVLHEISGRLVESIQFEIKSNSAGVFGYVYSEDPAEPLLEYGGIEAPREILPDVKKVMRFLGGSPLLHILSLGTTGMVYAAVVHRPAVTYPKHSVIHAAFDEMAGEIEHELESASHQVVIEYGPDWNNAEFGTGHIL